jgi:uncharacterized protein DUF2190
MAIGRKMSLAAGAGHYQTVAQAPGANKTKGAPELVGGVLCFPFEDYATSSPKILFVFKSEKVTVEAQAANADVAAVNFTLLQKVYWDAGASKVTNVSAGNTLIGRCLEAKDLSIGVAAGDQVLIELNPDV